MGIPIEYHLILIFLSTLFFLLVFMLMFVDVDFDKAIAGTILSFLNIVFCYVTGMGFFSFDIYGYDTTGTIVSNIISEYSELGIIFIGMAYIMVILLFYGFWLFFKKPWDQTRKIDGNPYVYYKGDY